MSEKITEVYKKDATLNNIHMSWGWDLPATDIDCLFVEYKYPNDPAALIEYKHKNWDKNFNKGPIKTVYTLACKADLPFYIVIWNNDPAVVFEVYAMNNQAKVELTKYNLARYERNKNNHILEGEEISEEQYINFMTFIRRNK